MCPIRLLVFMAKGWRGYLEEESEFQWIAMAGFFIFILLGAVAIQGTTNLPGVEVGPKSALLDEPPTRVLDIVYLDDESFTAQVVTPNGVELIQQVGEGNAVELRTENQGLSAENLEFITLLSNGNAVFSPSKNTINIAHSAENEPGNVVLISTIQLDNTSGEFNIEALGESKENENTFWMMVTDEENGTTLRGFGAIGEGAVSTNTLQQSMSSSTLSSPMVNSAGVVWQEITHLNDQMWVASGYLSFISTGAGANPASPAILPVVAVIEWDGTQSPPSIKSMHTGNSGHVHTLLALSDSTVFAAGTEESSIVHSNGDITHLDSGSVAAVVDDCDRVWLFGDVGSKTIIRVLDTEQETVALPRPLTFAAESSGFGEHHIFLHGVDDSGEVRTLTIDTTAPGSIESGRGFLNFMFVGVFSVVLIVMIWTAAGNFTRFKRI